MSVSLFSNFILKGLFSGGKELKSSIYLKFQLNLLFASLKSSILKSNKAEILFKESSF